MTLLHPDHLHSLNAWGGFGEKSGKIPFFPHVTELYFSTSSSTTAYNLTILSKFPKFNDMSMRRQVSEALPALQGCIKDEYVTLHLSHPRANTTCLTIEAWPKRWPSCTVRSPVTSLDIAFHFLEDINTAHSVCEAFPQLEQLRICFGNFYTNPRLSLETCRILMANLFTKLADCAFPSTLKHLAICRRNFAPPDPAHYILDLQTQIVQLRDMLLAKCPDLASLWLDGVDTFFQWRKSRDGMVAQEIKSCRPGTGTVNLHSPINRSCWTLDDRSAEYVFRQEFEAFWDTL
ncbi:hypothetical protein K438DRAFT_742886 [Mycena galopus ATCC 62051]|nr:hypothetical protein K438DRAFT_742886 [Mycena galopus ATCC 62051]